jgi:signal peptidase I
MRRPLARQKEIETQGGGEDKLLTQAQELLEQLAPRAERGTGLGEDVRSSLQTRLNELRHAIKENDAKRLRELTESLSKTFEEIGPEPKSALREYAESIGMAVLFAFVLRGFVVEAFKIPTGSMIPTLLVGDHLFVNKFIYGLRVPFTQRFVTRFSEPSRGEVVVFTFPREEARDHISRQPISRRECIDRSSLEEEKDFIKRIVALAGDKVELRNNHLIINDQPVKRTFIRKETTGNYLYPHVIKEAEELSGHTYTIQYSGNDPNFGPITVKPGHVFAMGDNRDNSSDSRCWGQVPVDHIKGRAMIIWWSIGPDAMRWDRIGRIIH